MMRPRRRKRRASSLSRSIDANVGLKRKSTSLPSRRKRPDKFLRWPTNITWSNFHFRNKLK